MSPSLKGGQVNNRLPSQASGSEKTKQGGREKNTELPLCFRVIYCHLLKVPSWAGKKSKYEGPSLDLQNLCKSWAGMAVTYNPDTEEAEAGDPRGKLN